MDYFTALKEIKQKKIQPIYLLYGTESYFIQNIVQHIKKGVAQTDDQNVSLYDLEEIPIEEVITDAETYPFFSERKLVIANHPVFLKAQPDKLAFEHNVETLETYIKQPVDYSTLILIAPYEKLDERKKIVKQLKKEVTFVECNAIKEYEITKWIEHLSKNLNIHIETDAYAVIERESSTNLFLLQNEMEKMALYVGENGVVTEQIAETLISKNLNSSAIRLVDAVIEQDLKKALSIYHDLIKMKEEPIAFIGLLAFQFRMLLRVKLLKNKGYGQQQLQKQIQAHPYVIKMALQREKRFEFEQLKEIMMALADADVKMKQGTMEKNLTFELLLYQLVQRH